MNYRNALLFVVALIVCVPVLAFAAPDVTLTSDGKVPGGPFEYLQSQIDTIELTPGADGLPGVDGADGAPGADGLPGVDGLPGADGAPGTNGSDGSPGVDGSDGLPGADGSPGADGAPGDDGADGAPGTNGSDGLPGADGAPGADGTDGLPGADGAPGTNGSDGSPGADGADGAPGADGTDGLPGADGADGLDGDTPWTDDGYGNVSTTGSVQIGNEVVDCDATTAGTIRFTGTDFEGCYGETWVSLSASGASASFDCGEARIMDVDGNWYDTVLIGSQCWMAENLNVGTRIDATYVQSDNSVIEKYCYVNMDANCLTAGGLYQWDEMMQYTTTGGAQGICPTGWHLPTDEEWKDMEKELGMSAADADGTGARGTTEGTKLKLGGSSGFEAILVGYYREYNSSFEGVGTGAVLYSSTSYWEGFAWKRVLGLVQYVTRTSGQVEDAASVRCVRD